MNADEEDTLVCNPPLRIVLDTSVMVATTRSRTGASFAIVRSTPNPAFEIALELALAANCLCIATRDVKNFHAIQLNQELPVQNQR